jgi:ubiquinone/menaquinone biosynthesis C-methylase UbiE/uncharacterized protein YbaR (Trm112 family)
MHIDFIDRLRCPRCGDALELEEAASSTTTVESGTLKCARGAHRYPIVAGIPRFVPAENYANNFGWQWQKFRRTQLDSNSGHPISAERFWKATGWTPAELAGQWVLDVGCGAGRFAEIALQAGARLVALDYSRAVDAACANLRQFTNFHAVQGDIYALPFALASFRYVYSLGVLQHTPNVAAAFAALPPVVESGGRLAVDFYEQSWKSWLMPKYWLRPLTKRMSQQRLFTVVEKWVPRLLPVARALSRIPKVGGFLGRVSPVANYYGVLPLTPRQQLEWSLLDTFDWYGPAYDNPQTAATLRTWASEAGMRGVEIEKAGHLVVRGIVEHAARD